MRIHLARLRSRLIVSGAILAAFLTVASIAARGVAGTATDVAYNQSNLIRLHIIANSDSEADQALKRTVRDEIIKRTAPVFRGVKSTRAAERLVRANLRWIESIGDATVHAAGYDYQVRAEYGTFPFPAKTYGSLTLPPGRYNALRVVIGKGQGKNWWCVLFPPLCFLKMDTPYANGRVKVSTGPSPSGPVASGPVRVQLVGPSKGDLSLLVGFPMTTPTRISDLLEALQK